MSTKMISDNLQSEYEFKAAHGIHSIPDEVSSFHLDDGKSRLAQRKAGKHFRQLSLFSKFHRSTHPSQISIKEEPVVEAHNGVDSRDSHHLPYPAFSSPLEDISFNCIDLSESSSEGASDQSEMAKLDRLSKLHDTHDRCKALFAAWDADCVLRPPSSPDVDAKRKWFR